MNENYINKIAESKLKYHRQSAQKTYEEKFDIIIALQKIDIEMKKNSKFINDNSRRFKIWNPEK